jgi:hypothetical protein
VGLDRDRLNRSRLSGRSSTWRPSPLKLHIPVARAACATHHHATTLSNDSELSLIFVLHSWDESEPPRSGRGGSEHPNDDGPIADRAS